MPYLAGVILALGASLMATVSGWDRNRALYPIQVIVIASCGALFAGMSGTPDALGKEALAIAVFLAAALGSFRGSLWGVVGALAAHGLFDLVHDRLIPQAGIPPWWPAFCFAYDLTAAGYLACLLHTARLPARRP